MAGKAKTKTRRYSGEFVTRITPTLHEELAAAAAANKRSLNAEATVAIEAHVMRESRMAR